MSTHGRLSRPIRLTMAVRIAATASTATVATLRVFIGWLLNQGSPSPAPTARRRIRQAATVGGHRQIALRADYDRRPRVVRPRFSRRSQDPPKQDGVDGECVLRGTLGGVLVVQRVP